MMTIHFQNKATANGSIIIHNTKKSVKLQIIDQILEKAVEYLYYLMQNLTLILYIKIKKYLRNHCIVNKNKTPKCPLGYP